MSIHLGYDRRPKETTGGSGVNTDGFTMSGDIDMDGNSITGLSAPSGDSSP